MPVAERMPGTERMPGAERMTDAGADAVLARISEVPLDRAALEAFALTPDAGALVVFEGVVRDHDGGQGVTALDYSAHPTAEAELTAVCREIADRGGLRIAAAHRIGSLGVGDVALVAVVASAHRAEAFAACVALAYEINKRVPIWKRQHSTDGEPERVRL